jgi:formylglycine-generating enzyme required for sulfatase activity/tRNA A-37 threonylcarbamoyl transferase component Bud32
VSNPLQPGAVFGRDFRIVRELRAGGMGAVYVVEQLSTGKKRALKVMAPALAKDPSIRDRFVLEARAASRIESDHVVEIVTAGVDEESGAPFLVMELLRGEELGDAIARVGHLPLGDVAEILAQVGHALEQAHANGIVHRDLKLENIFLATSKRRDSSFTAKVLDFGIAKLVADNQLKDSGTQPLGTPLFMSPEQTDRRGRIAPATDVWALGLIAFRLLTGHDFWRESEALPILIREIVVDPIPPASVRAAELGVGHLLPAGFDAWFARCVNRDIDARYPEAGAAVRAFGEIVPRDAPRGVLTATEPARSSPEIATTDPVSPTAATLATAAASPTGNAVAATGAPRGTVKRRSSASLVVGAALVLAVGAGGYVFTTRSRPAIAPGVPVPSAMSAMSAPTVSTPVTSSPVPHARCPADTVLLPGGKMFMGARDLADANPTHPVTVSAFCIDRTEVTTEAYMACVSKGECEKPPDQVFWHGISDEARKRLSPLCNAGDPSRTKHPINCVAWSMAATYCQKRGQRLPTEAEWEFAARGQGQRKYPWGDDAPSAKYLNACGKECVAWGVAHGEPHNAMYDEDDHFPATAPVGSFPAGASAEGVLDLAGNVWEWTADWYAPYGPEPAVDPKGPPTGDKRVARGGDYFGYEPNWARPAYRFRTDPDTYNHAIGFRCAADAQAEKHD